MEKLKKCCSECWNSKFALTGKNKEKFGCGLSCECHLNRNSMGITPEVSIPEGGGNHGEYITLKVISPTPQGREEWEERFDNRFEGWILQDSGENYRSFDTIKSFIYSEFSTHDEELVEKIKESLYPVFGDENMLLKKVISLIIHNNKKV